MNVYNITMKFQTLRKRAWEMKKKYGDVSNWKLNETKIGKSTNTTTAKKVSATAKNFWNEKAKTI